MVWELLSWVSSLNTSAVDQNLEIPCRVLGDLRDNLLHGLTIRELGNVDVCPSTESSDGIAGFGIGLITLFMFDAIVSSKPFQFKDAIGICDCAGEESRT